MAASRWDLLPVHLQEIIQTKADELLTYRMTYAPPRLNVPETPLYNLRHIVRDHVRTNRLPQPKGLTTMRRSKVVALIKKLKVTQNHETWSGKRDMAMFTSLNVGNTVWLARGSYFDRIYATANVTSIDHYSGRVDLEWMPAIAGRHRGPFSITYTRSGTFTSTFRIFSISRTKPTVYG